MKLVEILARELKWWPHCVSIVQDYDGYVGLYSSSAPYLVNGDIHEAVWHHQYHIRNIAELSKIASDHATAIVTSADWEAERARIAKPAKKADKDGWARHRGGKCPVGKGQRVDYRMRNGKIGINERAELLDWGRDKEIPCADIMAYRLHKPDEQPVIEPAVVANAQAFNERSELRYDPYADGPLQWRDRITEIDRTVEALEEERVSLVQRLEGEGFRLIERINAGIADAMKAHEDMSDWRNWKKGDIIQSRSDSGGYTCGKTYEVKSVNFDRAVVYTKLDEKRSKTNGWNCKFFKFHSRPSA